METIDGNPSDYPGFQACIDLVLTDGNLTFEEAFGWLVGEVPRVRNHIDQLITLMQSQTDPFKREKLITLLGYTASEKVIPVLKDELNHPDRNVRLWAVLSGPGHEFNHELKGFQ